MKLGDKIRELRKMKGLTQKDLAERLDIDFTYLSKVENNREGAVLSRENIIRLAEILDGDADELVELAGKKGNVPPSLETYFRKQPQARRIFRKAKDLDMSKEDWKKLGELMEDLKKDKNEDLEK